MKTLRKQLKTIQRRGLYKSDCSVSRNINNFLFENRDIFWKQVSKSRRLKKKRAPVINMKPNASEFVTFCRTLFSHEDRPKDVTWIYLRLLRIMLKHWKVTNRK